ncbi:hypothetical protein JCM6882_008460 [Rhodosporidiobolus microsporus]
MPCIPSPSPPLSPRTLSPTLPPPPRPPNPPSLDPSPVTRPSKPAVPAFAVDAKYLRTLIALTTYGDRCVRWLDPELPVETEGVEAAPDPPPWSLWLEGYYQMHHPATWAILERDQEEDKHFFWAMRDWRMQREQEGAAEDELGSLWDEMDEAALRMVQRFQRLFALHYVRNRYLAYHRTLLPAHSDTEILEATLVEEDYPPCTVAPHSVWALPIPPPTSFLDRFLRRRPLIQIAKPPFSSSPSLLQPYIVPGIDSLYMRALKPTPVPPGSPPEYAFK